MLIPSMDNDIKCLVRVMAKAFVFVLPVLYLLITIEPLVDSLIKTFETYENLLNFIKTGFVKRIKVLFEPVPLDTLSVLGVIFPFFVDYFVKHFVSVYDYAVLSKS